MNTKKLFFLVTLGLCWMAIEGMQNSVGADAQQMAQEKPECSTLLARCNEPHGPKCTVFQQTFTIKNACKEDTGAHGRNCLKACELAAGSYCKAPCQ